MPASKIWTPDEFAITTKYSTHLSGGAMRKKTKLRWSNRAENDLERLRRRITALGAPRTARSFVSRLRKYVSRLRNFPESGGIVEEYNDPSLREIFFQGQRIVYRYDGTTAEVIMVVHGSHVWDETDLLNE